MPKEKDPKETTEKGQSKKKKKKEQQRGEAERKKSIQKKRVAKKPPGDVQEKGPRCIVFCDTKNRELDIAYAEEIIRVFRSQTGWKVEEGTRIWHDLREFSKGYSKIRRDAMEVVTIFQLANGLLQI